MALLSGHRLGHYEVLEPIGAGGMGEVYRARDTKLGRDVAIKVLPEELARDRERLSRFEREAKMLASLNHPGIATLYGLEEHEGRPFLAMELVDGETLAERIARGRVPAEEAIPLFVHIAEALEAAHEKGVVHRDLKPANVKIASDGNPKLLDFGLARAFHGDEPTGDASQSPTLTKDTALGTILGTAAYMSPEQARGKAVDKRTDNWAFGCCLYEALTGKAVFRAETVSDTIANVLQREPDWNALPAETPVPVRELLQWCLEKDPKSRIRDVGDTLRLLDEGERVPAEPVTWSSHLLRWSIPALALGFLIASLMRPRAEDEPRDVVRFIAETIPFQSYIGGDKILDISSDGSRIVYIDDNDVTGAPQLFVRHLDETEASALPGTFGAISPFFSSDGQAVGYGSGNRAMLASLQGGTPVALGDMFDPRGSVWTDDDAIVFHDADVIWQVPASGGERTQVTHIDAAKRERSHRYPDVLPEGRGVLYTVDYAATDTWDDASINYVSLQTGESHIVIEGGTAPRYVPTGHIVYARAGSLFAVRFDLDSLQKIGQPVAVVDNVQMNPLSGSARFAVSKTGTLTHVRGGSQPDQRQLVWVDRSGNVEPLPVEPLPIMRAALSPNGNLIALDIESARGDIWVYDQARDVRTRLTFEWLNLLVGWNPDGNRITFRTSAGDENWLSQVSVDGSADIERLGSVDDPRGFRAGGWSPDGKHLAYTLVHPSARDIWVRPADEGSPRPLIQSEYWEEHPAFSPDGRWLAYSSNESGERQVYVRPFPEGDRKWQISTNGGVEPRWSRDGRELFFRDEGGNEMLAATITSDADFRAGRARLLFERQFSTYARSGPSYSPHPDGQRFLMLEDVHPEPAPIVVTLNWFEELKQLVPSP